MDGHIKVGNKYPSVKLNTTYSFGLDDEEFVVAFETEEPKDFLDLVMELRDAEQQVHPPRHADLHLHPDADGERAGPVVLRQERLRTCFAFATTHPRPGLRALAVLARPRGCYHVVNDPAFQREGVMIELTEEQFRRLQAPTPQLPRLGESAPMRRSSCSRLANTKSSSPTPTTTLPGRVRNFRPWRGRQPTPPCGKVTTKAAKTTSSRRSREARRCGSGSCSRTRPACEGRSGRPGSVQARRLHGGCRHGHRGRGHEQLDDGERSRLPAHRHEHARRAGRGCRPQLRRLVPRAGDRLRGTPLSKYWGRDLVPMTQQLGDCLKAAMGLV